MKGRCFITGLLLLIGAANAAEQDIRIESLNANEGIALIEIRSNEPIKIVRYVGIEGTKGKFEFRKIDKPQGFWSVRAKAGRYRLERVAYDSQFIWKTREIEGLEAYKDITIKPGAVNYLGLLKFRMEGQAWHMGGWARAWITFSIDSTRAAEWLSRKKPDWWKAPVVNACLAADQFFELAKTLSKIEATVPPTEY